MTLGACLLILFSASCLPQACRLKFLNPATPGQIFLFTGLSILAFILFVAVLTLLVRNVLKLYADQRSRVMGTRLRTRMLWGAVLVSLIPIVFMFVFSYGLMNRAIERWFSQPVNEMRDESNRMALELAHYTTANARAEADSIASSLPAETPLVPSTPLTRRSCRQCPEDAAVSPEPKPSTMSSVSTRSPCRTASLSSTATAAPSPPSTCPSRPEPPHRSRPGCPIRPVDEETTSNRDHPPRPGPERRHRRRHPRRSPAHRPARLHHRPNRLRSRHRQPTQRRAQSSSASRCPSAWPPPWRACALRPTPTGPSSAAAIRFATSTCCFCS